MKDTTIPLAPRSWPLTSVFRRTKLIAPDASQAQNLWSVARHNKLSLRYGGYTCGHS